MIENGSFIGYEGGEVEVDNYLGYFSKPMDFFVPAATEKSIHKGNADLF